MFQLFKIYHRKKQSTFMYILFITCSLVSCNSNKHQKNKPFKKYHYFDLTTFLNSQLKQLENNNFQIKKQVQFGEKTEVRILSNIKWKDELELFMDADINKSNLIGGYTINKNINGSDETIIYTANDKNFKTQKLIIKKENNFVQEITINIKESNELFNNEREMKLVFNKHLLSKYLIQGKQKNRLIFSYKIYHNFFSTLEGFLQLILILSNQKNN